MKYAAVYLAGLLQGLALVAFPAASSILTGSFHLSNSGYGSLFIPQALFSILCSLLTTQIWGNRTHFFIGMTANFISMALFALCSLVTNAYPLLLLATSCLGIGFGFTVPALNTMASLYFPKQMDRAVLILNTLLGLGTALAPLLTALFIGLNIWWGLPLLLALLILLLLLFSLTLSFPEELVEKKERSAIPSLFWLFALFALLYGMVETVNGNWATLYMKAQGADLKTASLALTLFWTMVTFGRLFFTAIDKFFPEKRTFNLLPFITAAAFLLIALLPEGSIHLSLFSFALAGFGCSALLPLIISFGEKALPSLSSLAGGLIAFYLLGYGIAAFGTGPLQGSFTLKEIFGFYTVISLGMGMLSFKLKSF